ncbi:unnamed protein product [Brassica napus]|uniref:glycerophosphodiester phosphodiesterase n=1 Tax=Brassica napus TaxID=3708 RepID=A0A816P0E7_BRANA|nr:unnamed protein product [Brassica napus]
MLTLNGKTLTFLTESLLRTGSPLTSPPRISKSVFCKFGALKEQNLLCIYSYKSIFQTVAVIRGILSRSPAFDDNRNVISTVENIATQFKPAGFWLNVQHDAFYAQHNLSMSGFLLSVSKTVTIDYLSSPELKFFRDIGSRRLLQAFLVDFKKQSPYETVYQVEETLGDIFDSAIEDIKKLADAVVVSRLSVYSVSASFFLTGQAKLVQLLH